MKSLRVDRFECWALMAFLASLIASFLASCAANRPGQSSVDDPVAISTLGAPATDGKPEPRRISGVVEGAKGEPLSGMRVVLLQSNNQVASTRSGGDGTFDFRVTLPKGSYELMVTDGASSWRFPLWINQDRVAGVELALK